MPNPNNVFKNTPKRPYTYVGKFYSTSTAEDTVNRLKSEGKEAMKRAVGIKRNRDGSLTRPYFTVWARDKEDKS